VRRVFTSLLILVFTGALLLFGAGLWWLHEPIPLRLPPGSQVVDLEIEPGTPPAAWPRSSSPAAPTCRRFSPCLVPFSGQGRLIKAGSYELVPGTTPRKLLSMLVRGDQALKSVTLVEGWNFNQVRAALQKAEQLSPDTLNLAPEAIMEKLGKPGVHPEGRFFPDTYTYAKGSSDLAVLKRAARAMDKRLDAAWALRNPTPRSKRPTRH
jgi:UPF0755 protein